MQQILTLNLDPATANALIASLQVAIKTVGYEAAKTAAPIITELLRQDEEFKKAQTTPANDGGEPSQP